MEESKNIAARYLVEPSLSRFTVRASASGMLKMFGHDPAIAIRGFEAEVRLDPDHIESSSLRLQVPASSLEVPDDMNSKDRRDMEKAMKEEVLETSRFPRIVFNSGKISAEKTGEGNFRVRIAGNLDLHGVTRNQQVAAQISLNGGTLRAFGEFSLLQTDFGIKPYSAAGGGLKLKDELKFSFDLVARKAPEPAS